MTGLRLTRAARERYGLYVTELPGQIAEIRRFLVTLQRPGETEAFQSVHAGQIQAAWLITAALSLVVDRYEQDIGQDTFGRALGAVSEALGQDAVDRVLESYHGAFDEPTAPRPGPAESLREVLFLWLANVNPAFAPMRALFDDDALRATDGYERLITNLANHLSQRPHFGPDHQALVAMLRSPAVAFPDSLTGQLAYIRERWGTLLGDILDRLLLGMGILDEEERAMWLRLHGAAAFEARRGEGVPVYNFEAFQQGEQEAFTPDRDWHPRLVLLAKSVYVWLDQLSKKYGQPIQRLDQIPDEELDLMAAWGMTGLWLIGIWQRSRASEQIKRIRGNPDAAASAYSLEDYRVADELGGDWAWTNLSERAGQRGLKLAADMVPNHMGLDSHWVVEHPEWFLSLSEPPYPGYSFNGPELSPTPDVSIKIEDHYWDGTDAAVVFQRQDRRTGETRYIYHGNDGTVMPWNDTAQLNYIDANVREQVIQTILSVARRFPVIRFDAAMVLTRQHIRRLWWPEPGSGGAIASRAERSIPPAAFDQAMPGEFWREVVDRVASEGLDTLLLAEAFWLLEGYFVRTLGMHRVYNSAFMHMFRDERNAEYHLVMRNTLEFDPEVLKRFVNFMSNPDEDTAVEQFGKGDKYFGVCTMLATLPGLPMFGHGQVEGFAEKYGMEYRRAYHAESVDDELVWRHEREIFPILQRRAQFAEVRDFLLYEFETDGGGVNEDVFAYSNGRGPERSLIMYHNTYATTAGTIRQSVPFMVRDGDNRYTVRRRLAEGLGLTGNVDGVYLTFRDAVSGLEYLRPAREIQERGIWVTLGAYERNVFLDFAEVADGPGAVWRRLNERLAGRGVPSLAAALDELVLEEVQAPFRRIANPEAARVLVEAASPGGDAARERLFAWVVADARQLAIAASELSGGSLAYDEADVVETVERTLRAAIAALSADPDTENSHDLAAAGALLILTALRALGGSQISDEARARYVDDWRLVPIVATLFGDLGIDEPQASALADAVRVQLPGGGWPSKRGRSPRDDAQALITDWLADAGARRAIGMNRYEGVDWFGAEAFANMVHVTATTETMRALEAGDSTAARQRVSRVREVAALLSEMSEQSGYRVDALDAKPGTDNSVPSSTSGPKPARRPTAAKPTAAKKTDPTPSDPQPPSTPAPRSRKKS